MVIAVFIK